MGAVHTAAAAVDTAIGSLNTALASFVSAIVTARTTAVAANITAGNSPTGGIASIPMYEDPGAYIRGVMGQTGQTVLLLKGLDFSNTTGVTVAGQIPSSV